jgi:osmotically-inducible protein OsmY
VTLSGQVDWHFQKQAAAQEVTRLAGVVGVSDEVVVRPRVDAERLGSAITHAMGRSWFFDPETITVSAEAGRVHLGGTARTLHEKQVAASTAWAAPGVMSVQNDIVVL